MTPQKNPTFKFDLWLITAMSFLLGAALWIYSDLPPYGSVANELSNHAWGLIADIAHKWRTGDFSFWDRGIGGGTSLYTSGYYPLFHPTNILAWVLDNDRFFLLKIIEPYVIGFFFTALVLRDVFRLGWPYVIFGGLYYLGFGISRFSTITDSPCFLWGCGLFPAMVYAFIKLEKRGPYVQSAVTAALVALQFFGEGATQLLQMILWWLVFFTVKAWVSPDERPLSSRVKTWLGSCAVFVLLTFGLTMVQFLPTYLFVVTESARRPGQYPVNNFPLWGEGDKGSLGGYFASAVMSPGGASMRGILALVIVSIGMFFLRDPKRRAETSLSRFPAHAAIACAAFFTLPTIAGVLVRAVPALAILFKPLTMFTFAYVSHTIDFAIMLGICLMIGNEKTLLFNPRDPLPRRIAAGLVIALAVTVVMAPFVLSAAGMTLPGILKDYSPGKAKSAFVVFMLTVLAVSQITLRTQHPILRPAAAACLVFLGFMTTVTAYHWNNKGKQTHPQEYHMATPEYAYYRSAAGRYYLPYENMFGVAHNFNLLYGVHGTDGFLQLPKKRLNQFIAGYHNGLLRSQTFWWIPKYYVLTPSSGLAARLSADFTTVEKGKPLDWEGFSKKIDGERFDVWARDAALPPVRFSDRVRVADFSEIIENFDKSPGGEILVDINDAGPFSAAESRFAPLSESMPSVSGFSRESGDRLNFRASAKSAVAVVVPEMFQSGWQARINGKAADLFPADYLFIGFRLPAGEFDVTLRYVPPGLRWGTVLTLISLGACLLVLLRHRFSLQKGTIHASRKNR
ncbi:MAG: YfhO family protein [Candidatus Omnitrophota bacterium]|nr:YfhO family protein [Candidatus Omnitrophota bacterium]